MNENKLIILIRNNLSSCFYERTCLRLLLVLNESFLHFRCAFFYFFGGCFFFSLSLLAVRVLLHEVCAQRIPADFVKKYGQNLPNRLFLRVPNASVREVDLVQSNGETLLQKGWPEFTERYSIGFGHLLVFEYDGNSQFDVLIFNRSATEINSPFDDEIETDQPPKVEDSVRESDDSAVSLEQFFTNNRGKAKNLKDSARTESDVYLEVLENPSAREHNRRKWRHFDDTFRFSGTYPLKESVRTMQNLSSCFQKRSRSKFPSPTYNSDRALRTRVKLEGLTSEECSGGTRRQCLDIEQKQKAIARELMSYQKAIAFAYAHTFRNPFFISRMQPPYVSGRFSLNVPLTFARRNLPCRTTKLTLRLSNRKAWSVSYSTGGGHSKLSSGWKNFVRNNALKVGDACIFEVAKNNKNFVWNVIIFRS